jgi:hypothetical protein
MLDYGPEDVGHVETARDGHVDSVDKVAIQIHAKDQLLARCYPIHRHRSVQFVLVVPACVIERAFQQTVHFDRAGKIFCNHMKSDLGRNEILVYDVSCETGSGRDPDAQRVGRSRE